MRERYTELRADEAALEADARRGRGEGARDRLAATLADVREAMGVGPRAQPSARIRRASLRPVRAVPLELDLDVFAGPFDLLLALILREELDLLEVELAEVVLAYLDHLEARGSSTSRSRRVPRAGSPRCSSSSRG